jgi:CubicO group peptidase (beta-lactamase class C family)
LDPIAATTTAAFASGGRFAAVISLLDDAIRALAFPGASLAVTLQDGLELLHHAGRHTYASDSPAVTARSLFDLASVTKVMATTPMAMLLLERGRLRLEQPLIEVLPEFGAISDAMRHQVTVRMLLDHSSGLPAYVPLFERCHTRDEVLALACHTHLKDIPGRHTEYSDIGFILLGHALERLAGEAMDTFCQREVFTPLGLDRTRFLPTDEMKQQAVPTAAATRTRAYVIQGEVHDQNAWAMGGVAGHAGLFSTAEDVARFARTILSGGAPVLRPETVATFTAPGTGGRRMLGWDVPSHPSQSGRYFSARSFGHLGYTGTSLWCDPERQVSVTLLTNRTWPDDSSQAIRHFRPRLHEAIFEVLGLA